MPDAQRGGGMDAIRVFRRTARRDADATFAFDVRSSVTYGQADRRSDEIAAELADAGLMPGDTVGLSSPDSVEQLIAILATWKAGLVPGLVDARIAEGDLPYFVDDVGAKLVLAVPELHEGLRA